jgi:hypothetical protein
MALTVCLLFDRDPSGRFESRRSIAHRTFTPKPSTKQMTSTPPPSSLR